MLRGSRPDRKDTNCVTAKAMTLLNVTMIRVVMPAVSRITLARDQDRLPIRASMPSSPTLTAALLKPDATRRDNQSVEQIRPARVRVTVRDIVHLQERCFLEHHALTLESTRKRSVRDGR